MSRHLLVTNDFPPKIGGIQNYLWELWRRLPAEEFAIYTTPYRGATTFDAEHGMRIERSPEPVIGPYPWLVPRINAMARAEDIEMILLDPALPLGAIGPYLDRPYGVILHGAEVTVPARLPGSRRLLRSILEQAVLVVAAGHYPLDEAERCVGRALPSVVVPPGVDHERFRPLDREARAKARAHFGLGDDEFVIASVNRLVPRKGMDLVVEAAAELARRPGPPIRVLLGGRGRHERHLRETIEKTRAPVELLGRLPDADVALLYGAADAMVMLCHDRWLGLEQEGFGIAFLEAAAAGLPQVAGRSGGAHEAVEHGTTGFVVDDPRDTGSVADDLDRLRNDPELRRAMGAEARNRAVGRFDYDDLAASLRRAIEVAVGRTAGS